MGVIHSKRVLGYYCSYDTIWYDTLGYFLLEGGGNLDQRAVGGRVGPTAERQAAAGISISRLGEDAIGSWFHVRPETVMRLEALPLNLAEDGWLLHKISPGSMERVNVSVLQEIECGRQVIAEAGRVDAYDTHKEV